MEDLEVSLPFLAAHAVLLRCLCLCLTSLLIYPKNTYWHDITTVEAKWESAVRQAGASQDAEIMPSVLLFIAFRGASCPVEVRCAFQVPHLEIARVDKYYIG